MDSESLLYDESDYLRRCTESDQSLPGPCGPALSPPAFSTPSLSLSPPSFPITVYPSSLSSLPPASTRYRDSQFSSGNEDDEDEDDIIRDSLEARLAAQTSPSPQRTESTPSRNAVLVKKTPRRSYHAGKTLPQTSHSEKKEECAYCRKKYPHQRAVARHQAKYCAAYRVARTDKGLLRVEPAQTRAAVFPSPPVAQANDNASTSSGSASQQNIEEVVPSSSPNAARRGQAAVRLSASAPTDLQAAAASLPLQNAGAGLRDRENLCQQGGNAVASHPPPVLIVERPTVPAAPADCGDSRTNLRREREDEETSEHDPETSERVPKRPRTGDAVCGASSPAVPTSSLSSFEMQQQYRESLQKFSKTKLEDLFFGTLSRPILNSFKICNYYYADDLIGFIRSDLETMKSFVEIQPLEERKILYWVEKVKEVFDKQVGMWLSS